MGLNRVLGPFSCRGPGIRELARHDVREGTVWLNGRTSDVFGVGAAEGMRELAEGTLRRRTRSFRSQRQLAPGEAIPADGDRAVAGGLGPLPLLQPLEQCLAPDRRDPARAMAFGAKPRA